MARTKDAVLAPEQKELMEKEYLDFVKPSTYGNKANPSSCNSLCHFQIIGLETVKGDEIENIPVHILLCLTHKLVIVRCHAFES